MTFNPRNLYEPDNYRTTSNVVRVSSRREDGSQELKMIEDPYTFKFASLHHVFGCVRAELSVMGEPGFLIKNSARYAISDDQLKIPSLFHPEDKVFVFDPLLPYRNPIIDLYRGKTVVLMRMQAETYYFAPGNILC